MWAAVAAVIALPAVPDSNADAFVLVGLASVLGPLAAVAAAVAVRGRRDRLAGLLLVLSAVTPTYFAFALNLPAIVVGFGLLVSPKKTLDDSDGSSAPPVADRARRQLWQLGLLAAALGGGVVAVGWWATGPSACTLVTSSDLAALTGKPVGPSAPFTPEGEGGRGRTGCHVGIGTDVSATVFAAGKDAGSYFERVVVFGAADVGLGDVSRAGVEALVTGGPRDGSESLVLLRHGVYVNVVLYGAPAGAVARLVPVIAGRIH